MTGQCIIKAARENGESEIANVTVELSGKSEIEESRGSLRGDFKSQLPDTDRSRAFFLSS